MSIYGDKKHKKTIYYLESDSNMSKNENRAADLENDFQSFVNWFKKRHINFKALQNETAKS